MQITVPPGFSRKVSAPLLTQAQACPELGGLFDQPVKSGSVGIRIKPDVATALNKIVGAILIDETPSVGASRFQAKAELVGHAIRLAPGSITTCSSAAQVADEYNGFMQDLINNQG